MSDRGKEKEISILLKSVSSLEKRDFLPDSCCFFFTSAAPRLPESIEAPQQTHSGVLHLITEKSLRCALIDSNQGRSLNLFKSNY